MLLVSWVIALSFLTLFFRDLLQSRVNPNRAPFSESGPGFNQVVLQRNRQHHYVTSGRINEQPVVFLIDTGATHVALSSQMARRLGLKAGDAEMHITANGRVKTHATVINQLQIGTITLTNVRASITPGLTMDEVLLGMSALKDVEFVHRQGELTLRQVF